MKKQITSKVTATLALAFIISTFAGLMFNIRTVQAGVNNDEKKIAQKVAELKQQNVFKNAVEVFSKVGNNNDAKISKTVKNYALLKTNNTFAEVLAAKPDYLKLVLPSGKNSESFSLLLYKVDISPGGLTVLTSDGGNQPDNSEVVNYRGIIENDNLSVAAITFSENETMGVISNKDGNYVLGKMENNTAGLYIVYNDHELVGKFNLECATNTDLPLDHSRDINPNQSLSVNCVNWYWETDYDIYVGKGSSVTNVTNYLNGIFNQVSTLYANDGMSITLQTVFIWTTTDPYTGPSTSDYLNQFGSYRTSFSGNLATLLGYQGGGGVAWVNGFCSSTSHKMAYCGISSNYENVPTYSWTVEVVAHEEGHLFGSSHTHSCVWNGNNTKIDACGDVAGYPSGSCPLTNPALPPGGGTIMSYCHLTSVGINLSLGFGPQPKTLMLNNENNSSCLSACSSCTLPSQPGTISGSAVVCSSTSQSYSISPVSGATSYTWTLPSGWSGASTSTSITTTAGSAGGTIYVIATNTCGSSTARTLTVSVNTIPAQPGAISGATSICAFQQGVPYSISAVAGATSYTWIGTKGSRISDGTTTSTNNSLTTSATAVTINYKSTAGSIKVKASNACGTGIRRFLNISMPCRESAVTETAITEINISPNPAHDKLNVTFYAGEKTIYTLRVFDLTGRTLSTISFNAETGNTTHQVDVSNLAKGIYMFEIKIATIHKTLRFVKE